MIKKITIDIREIEKMLSDKYVNKHKRILTELMQGVMMEVDAWGKQSAPWRDRTGVARLKTGAKTKVSKDIITGTMGIDVWYGRFLEYSNGGRYRIVKPMFYKARQRLNNGLRQLGYEGNIPQSI